MSSTGQTLVSSSRPSRLAGALGGIDPRVALFATALLAGGAYLAGSGGGARFVWLWFIAAGLGVTLYHASFGFTTGYRDMFRTGATGLVRGQILMLALAVALFYPAIAAGQVFGFPVRGFVFPFGWELVIGAFLFGVGMQLGGGCGSGTLYKVGGGTAASLLTLVFFVVGATLAAFTFETWSGLPKYAPYSLPGELGLGPALALQLGALALLWIGAVWLEKRRTGAVASIFAARQASLLRGPWPIAWGAIGLAGLAFATLIVAGRPWGLTQAFALWGSWIVEATRLDDPTFWAYWEDPTRVDQLQRSFWADLTSVMDAGIIVGALAAAVLAGKLAFNWRIRLGVALGSVIGGLLLGFGSIMATGCNIAAFFAGVSSGSLHGWVWLLAALPGNALGVLLRPLFGLDRDSR